MKRFLVVFLKITAFPFLAIFFKVKSKNKHYLKKIQQPFLIVANHTSKWDGVFIHHIFLFKRLHFLTLPSQTKRSKISKFFLSIFGIHFIKNDHLNINLIDYMVDLINKNQIVTIFPEGKINNREKFNKGAAYIASKTNCLVLPLHIGGNFNLFKRAVVTFGKPFRVNDFDLENLSKSEKINFINQHMRNTIDSLN